jgi:hypothetical protein
MISMADSFEWRRRILGLKRGAGLLVGANIKIRRTVNCGIYQVREVLRTYLEIEFD